MCASLEINVLPSGLQASEQSSETISYYKSWTNLQD